MGLISSEANVDRRPNAESRHFVVQVERQGDDPGIQVPVQNQKLQVFVTYTTNLFVTFYQKFWVRPFITNICQIF
jgi:hypothetical protein